MAFFQSNLKLYGLVSTSLFIWTVLHAFRQRSNFYSAAVYLSKSNASLMILWNQGIYQTILFGKVLQWIFFGELRIIEVERLQERGWFAVTETLLALTIFKDEFDSSFVMLFVSLLFLKVFHWLAADRVEMMEQSAHIPRRFHLRMAGLLSLLWIFDLVLLAFAVESILLDGPTVMIMFASEYMVLVAAVWSTTMKYGLNIIDLRSEVPWEEKSIYVFYVDLATDFFKLATYLTFFCLILTFYGLPLNILRDVYVTFRSFVLKIRDLRRYRQATRNMDSLYPDASLEEMERMDDKTCIICREDMEYRGAPAPPAPEVAGEGEQVAPAPAPAPATPAVPRTGPNDTPKKLPCGHVFHFHCLRSWLERQQSCPTCRRPVLPQDQTRAQAAAAAVAARAPPAALPAGDDAIRQAQINLARNLGREAFGVVFPGLPFPPEALLPAAPAAQRPPPHQHQPGGVVPLAPTVAGAAAGPAPPSGATPLPAGTRVAGAGGDNPLARFSLPELRLPPTGEAGLYIPPTTTAHGYAGVAYGAYPQPQSMRPVGQAAGSHARVPNLEERLAHIRTRMAQGIAQAETGQNANVSLVPTPTTPEVATTVPRTTPTPTTPLATPATASPPEAGPSPATSDATTSNGTTPQLSAREAALAAAERRAKASKSDGIPSASAPNTALPQAKLVRMPGVPTALVAHVLGMALPTQEEEDIARAMPQHPLDPPVGPALGDVKSKDKGKERAIGAARGEDVGVDDQDRADASSLARDNKERVGETVELSSTIPPTSERPATPSLTPLSRPPTGTSPRPSPDFFSLGPSGPAGPSSPASPQSGTPASYPRLIPLFNPSNPLATTLYPHLLSSMPPSLAGPSQPSSQPRSLESRPLVPQSPTDAQLRELSQLTRSGIEERLRVLVGFQERMAALASDMGRVLSVLPPEEQVVEDESQVRVDKGKAPVEEIHAVEREEGTDGSTVEGVE